MFLLVLATIMLVIVMTNMLIAVISADFEKVTSKSVQYSFKEKVLIINDIYDTFGERGLFLIKFLNRLGSFP